MKYWDSSAIVPLVIKEASSAFLSEALEADSQLMAWWGTRIEIISALARGKRTKALSPEELQSGLVRLQQLLSTAKIVAPSNTVAKRAERLLFVHELRAADALQLAAALVVAQERPQGFEFVSLDHRLRDAAAREGFTIIPS